MKTLIALSGLLLSVVACSHNAYTPPARTIALASPDTLNKGETSVRASMSGATDIFGPEVATGSMGLRQGLDERLEVAADISYLQVIDTSVANTNRGVGMARVGTKYRPTSYEHLALVGGVGGGYSPAAGAYLSVDGGAVIGYENPYLVPYVSGGLFGSVPLSPNEIDVTAVDDGMTYVDTPEATLGLTLSAGLKLPVKTAALHLGFTVTTLRDDDSKDQFLSIAAGVESAF